MAMTLKRPLRIEEGHSAGSLRIVEADGRIIASFGALANSRGAAWVGKITKEIVDAVNGVSNRPDLVSENQRLRARVEALEEACESLWPVVSRKADVGACMHDTLYGSTWETLRRNLARALKAGIDLHNYSHYPGNHSHCRSGGDCLPAKG